MTNEQIIAALGVSLTQMVEALRAADALNALKLGGKTLEEIKTEITGDVDLSNVVLKTDDLGQYEVEVILPGLPDPQRLNLAGLLATQASQGKVTQDALQNFIANPATEEDAQAGIDNTKYLTALGLKAVIDALTLKVFGEMPVGTDIRPFGSRPTSSTTELYDLQANPDGLTYSYDINSVGVCTYDLITNPGNPVRGLVWNLTGLPEGVNIRLDIDSVISGGPNSNYVGFTATPAATNPGADTAVTGGETSYNFVYDSATPFLMVRSDYPNDNLTHLTCTLFAEINGEQVTVFNNFSGNADSILKLRQDLANLQTEVDGKLNADGQAADSAKLEGKTLAEVLASIPPATGYVTFADGLAALIGTDARAITAVADGKYVGEVTAAQAIAMGIPAGNDGVLTVLTFDGVVAGRPSRVGQRTFVEAQGRNGLGRVYKQSLSYSSSRPNLGTWTQESYGQIDFTTTGISALAAEPLTTSITNAGFGVFAGPVTLTNFAFVNAQAGDEGWLEVTSTSTTHNSNPATRVVRELRVGRLATGKVDIYVQNALIEGVTVVTAGAWTHVVTDSVAFKAEILASIPPSTAMLDFTQAPYNVFVNDMGYSDYAAIGPGVYTGVVPNNDNVNPHLNLESGMETAVMTVWIAPANSQKPAGSLEVARKVEILGNASDDGVVHATMYHYASINADGSTVSDSGWVTVASQAFVTTAVNALKTALLGGGDSAETLKKLRDDLSAFIAKKATGAEAIAGTDDEKYITALALKAKVDDAINALVNGAPEAYDTLKELADALADQDDALAALVTQLGTKLDVTGTAADSSKFGGKTVAERTAADADAVTGTDTEKWITSANLKAALVALDLEHGLYHDLDMTQAPYNALAAAPPSSFYGKGMVVGRCTALAVGLTGPVAMNSRQGALRIFGTIPVGATPTAAQFAAVQRHFTGYNGMMFVSIATAADTWGAWTQLATVTGSVQTSVVAGSQKIQNNLTGLTSNTPSTIRDALLALTGVESEVLAAVPVSVGTPVVDGAGIQIPELAGLIGDGGYAIVSTIYSNTPVNAQNGIIEQEVKWEDLVWRRWGFTSGGSMGPWLKIGGGVAEDANKLGGHDASYFAVKDDVNNTFLGLIDQMDTLTDQVNGITRLSMTLTPGSFGGTEFGYEKDDRGTLTPSTWKDADLITDLTWNPTAGTYAIAVQGDYRTSTLISVSIGGVVSTSIGAPVFASGVTEWPVTVATGADTIPTATPSKVVVRATILPKA